MAITLRARKRLVLLAALVLMFSVFVTGGWFLRQWIRGSNVDSARVQGLELWKAHDYEAALPLLSLAVTYDKKNPDLLIALADTRSRVYAPNGKHLTAAMRYYGSVIFADPENIEALRGLMRVQMELGRPMIAQLSDTAKSLHVLIPDDKDPIRILKDIAVYRGNFAAPEGMAGTPGDESAIYWNDLLIELEPSNLRHRMERFVLMEQDKMLPKSEIIDLGEQWADEADPSDGSFDVLLAKLYLQYGEELERAGGEKREELEEAGVRLVVDAVNKGIQDPSALLLAIDILQGARNSESIADWAEDGPDMPSLISGLQETISTRATTESFLAKSIVRKPWLEGQISQAAEKLLEYQEQIKDEPRDIWEGSLLLYLAGDMDSAHEWASALKSLSEDSSGLTARQAQALSNWIEFLDLTEIDNPGLARDMSSSEASDGSNAKLAQVLALEDLVLNIPNREFIGIVVGDIYSDLGMLGPAAHHYSQAMNSSGSIPVAAARRLISTLLADRRPLQALPISEMLVGRYPNILSTFLQLIRVRAQIERAGLDPAEEGATILPELTSYDLINRLSEEQINAAGLQPMIAEAAIATGQVQEARDILKNAFAAEETDERALLSLIELGMQNNIFAEEPGLLDSSLARLEEVAESRSVLDSAAVIRSGILQRQGKLDDSLAVLEARFGAREDANARLILNLELLDYAAEHDPEGIAEAIGNVIDLNPNYPILQRVLRIAIQAQLLDVANEVYGQITGRFGEDFPGTLFAESDLVLGFPEAPHRGLSKIIADLELLADRNPASIDIASRQYRLLDRLDPNDLTASTQVLEEVVNAHPGALEFYPPLIAHLQKSGRFRESEAYVGRYERYRLNASTELQRAMAGLKAGQGDVEAALESLKDIAERPDATISDKIQYLDLLFGSMRQGEADAYLQALLEDPEHPLIVDLRAARRAAQVSGIDSGLALLDKAAGFKSNTDRKVAKANLLARYSKWDAALAELSYGEDQWERSFDSAFLAAKSLRSLGRFDEASEQFIDAAELADGREELLMAITNEQMPFPQLRGNIPPILEQVDNPERVEIMTLAINAAGPDFSFEPDEADLQQATQLTNKYSSNVDAWNLAIQLHGAADTNDFEEIIVSAINRFPSNAEFPRIYARYLLDKGQFERSLSFATLADERSPGSRIRDTVLRGQAMSSLGQFAAVATMMDKLKNDIIAKNQSGPPDQNWLLSLNLYLSALMETNRVNEAWTVLQETGARPPIGYDWWRRKAVTLPFAEGRESLDLLSSIEAPDSVGMKIAMALSWTSLAQQTGNDQAREKAMELVEDLRNGGLLANPFHKFRVELAYAGVQELRSPVDAMESYRIARTYVPDGVEKSIMNTIMAGNQMPQELIPYANVLMMALNNHAALSATLGVDLDLALDSVNQALAMSPGNPELLDTRAMVYLADNQPAKAMADAMVAEEARPERLGFKLTLAKALIASNRLAEAEKVLDDLDQKSLMQPEPDLKVREEVDRLRARISERIAG